MLFKDSTKLLEYAELTGVNFPAVKPTIRIVEEHHIVPALGTTLYNALNDKYTTAESTLTDAEKNLLEYCRRAIGPYTAYYYTPKAEIKVGDSGAQRAETTTNKTAYGYQVKNYREQTLRDGESAVESLLQFLEDNKIQFPDWQNSDAFKDYRSLFIKTGSEFKTLLPSHSPNRNYCAMRSKMYDVENNNIIPAIGEDLFDYLKAIDQNPDGTFSPKETILVFKLKKAIAYLTVGYALPFLAARIDANGITVISLHNSVASINEESRTAASDKTIENFMKSCISSGEAWLQNAINYCAKYPLDFPLFPIVVVVTDMGLSPNFDITGSFGLI